eukprot:465849_1
MVCTLDVFLMLPQKTHNAAILTNMEHHFEWKFDHLTQDYMTFIQSRDQPDVCFQSKRHTFQYRNENIPFYLECTPNGFSPYKVPKGKCALWLGIPLSELPPTINGVDVACTVICQKAGYKQQSCLQRLGVQQYSFAIGPPFISFESLSQKASWRFDCYIDIKTIIYQSHTLHANIKNSPSRPNIENNPLSQQTIRWSFNGPSVTAFLNAKPNADIPKCNKILNE